MRNLQRNNRTFWYALFKSITEITDDYGNSTGEYEPTYENPVQMKANISPARGAAIEEWFGREDNYDKVIVTSDMTCPIDENTILFVDKEPPTESGAVLDYDYVVTRVSKSINEIAIGIKRVKTS